MRKYFTMAACLALVSASGFAANDIAGIKTGVSLASQKALITKVNPKYQFTDVKMTSGKVTGLQAIAEINGKPVDHMIVLNNDAGIVWFVGRTQALDQGARLTKETLMKSLTEKYGKPSGVNVMTTEWEFDRDGKLAPLKTAPGPCTIGHVQRDAPFNKIPGTAIAIPRSFTPTCGTHVQSMTRDDSDDMVSAFTVTIVDAKRMYDELNSGELNEAAKRKKALDAEKAKNTKPIL